MAYYGTADIDFALSESLSTITHDGTTVSCLLDTPDELGLDVSDLGGVTAGRIVATIRTGAITPSIGSLVVVDAVNHYVRQQLRAGDGALQLLLLSRAAPASGPDEETPTSWVGNDVPFVLGEAADGLPNAAVLSDSTSVEVDRTEAGVLRLNVIGSAAGGMQTYPITDPGGASGFNGVNTTFVGLLPAEPDLTGSNEAFAQMSGKGILRRTASAPAAYEFRLSGLTNQDVEFGYTPDAGDFGNATFKPA